MAVSQRLDLRQSQSLVMTPQLQQAIRLLQLSNLELLGFVEQELVQNPLLEREEGEEPASREQQEPAGETTQPNDSLEHFESSSLPEANDAPLDNDEPASQGGYDEVTDWSHDSGAAFQRTGSGGAPLDDDGGSAVQRLSEEATLREHLLNQVQLDLSDPVDRLIALHLIDLLDEAGYVSEPLDNVAELLDCEVELVEATLKQLQAFDPPGIFARDLKECLSLQLADLDRLDPAMACLLDNLELVARGQHDRLMTLCGVDDEDLADMLCELRALDPKPGLAFDARVAEPVIPDIIMRPGPKGDWLLELNSETLPRVLVNHNYHARLYAEARKKKDREYLTEQLQSATWLVKALHQRATTILKVGTELAKQQDGFFRKGVAHLKPLTLRDVAEAIEMHESTVSRVTSNKYIATPRGTYELKYFFTAAISGTDGEAHSAEAVRHRIKALIDEESPKAILSDDGIVTRLRGDGIDIARRTVAKYREAMRIPSSVERRRLKAAKA